MSAIVIAGAAMSWVIADGFGDYTGTAWVDDSAKLIACADGDTGASVNRLTEAPERCQVGRTPPKIRQTTRCCPTRKNLTMEP